MLLLFWYLPFILFSGACEPVGVERLRVERNREP